MNRNARLFEEKPFITGVTLSHIRQFEGFVTGSDTNIFLVVR